MDGPSISEGVLEKNCFIKIDSTSKESTQIKQCAIKDCNFVISFNSRYCSKHSRQSSKLYRGYKHQQKHIDQYLRYPSSLFDASNEVLISVMYRCNKVIKLRRLYRETFCLPKDRGHELMILELIALADQILELLTQRFNIDPPPSEEETSLTSSSDDVSLEITWIATTVKKLKIQRSHLQDELAEYIEIKKTIIDEIKSDVIDAINQITPYVTSGNLTLEDKASFIVCSIVTIRNGISHTTIGDCDGLTCYCALLDWEAYPDTFEDLVEAIYQNRAPVPKFEDGEINLRCLGMLIDQARIQRTPFRYHFKLSVVNFVPTWEIVTHHVTREVVAHFRKSRRSFI